MNLSWDRVKKWPEKLIVKTVDEIKAIRRLRRISRKKRPSDANAKIRVGFIVQMVEIWDKEVDVYEEMNNRENFETILLVVPPFDMTNWSFGTKYDNNFFLKKYSNAIRAINEEGSIIDIESLKLDYVFFQRPYNSYLPDGLKSKDISEFAKCCYIPYGIENTYYYSNVTSNRDFFKFVFFSFFDSEYMCKRVKKKFIMTSWFTKQKFLNIGYPVLEHSFNIGERDVYKKSIMWTPRWSFDKAAVASHFLDYKDLWLDCSKRYTNVQFVFRPHPFLYNELKAKQIMSDEEIQNYKDLLINNNVILDTEKAFMDRAKDVDILITDLSGVIIQFFVTGRPIIFCNSDYVKYNDMFQKMYDCMYVANSEDDIKRYVEDLINGIDPLKRKRLETIEMFFSYHKGAVKQIVDTIQIDYEKNCTK